MRLRLTVPAGLLLGFALGCAGGPKLESLSPDALFARGLKEYQAHHWQSAIDAFERLALQYPTAPRIQEARFDLAQAYVGKKEYVTAAAEFSRLADDFPAGPYADDARFGVCRAYDRLSPDIALDQEYTRSAIEHCQSLILYYPTSEFADSAKNVIATLTNKLAQKVILGGNFYFKRHAYDSALIYYEDVLKEYPTTPTAPEALLHMVETYQELGYTEDAQAARERLLKEYPDSPSAKQIAEAPARSP